MKMCYKDKFSKLVQENITSLPSHFPGLTILVAIDKFKIDGPSGKGVGFLTHSVNPSHDSSEQ